MGWNPFKNKEDNAKHGNPNKEKSPNQKQPTGTHGSYFKDRDKSYKELDEAGDITSKKKKG